MAKTNAPMKTLDLNKLAAGMKETDRELPAKQGVGRDREPNPFDEVVAKAAKTGKTQVFPVVLGEKEESQVIVKLRAAAQYLEPKKSKTVTVRRNPDTELLEWRIFEFKPRQKKDKDNGNADSK